MKTDVEIVLPGEKDHIIMIVSPIRGNMCFSPSNNALFYFEPSRYTIGTLEVVVSRIDKIPEEVGHFGLEWKCKKTYLYNN